jgi:hypothetical protein
MEINSGSQIQRVIQRPTTVNKVHESIYRSYAILDYAEWLLEHDTPPDVVLWIIRDLRRLENKDADLSELT